MSDTSIFRETDPKSQPSGHIYNTTSFHRKEEVGPDDPILEELIKFRIGLQHGGWEPIPCRGKNVLLPGWTRGVITPERIREECSNTKLNTSFRTGRAVGVDNDLRDPLHAWAADELRTAILGPTPLIRFGAKGSMAIYYNRQPIRKLTITATDGTRLYEILGQGEQLVGFGRHPSGMDYRWQDIDPSMILMSNVPEVNENTLLHFHAQMCELLKEIGYDLITKRKPATETKPKPVVATSDLDWEDREALCRFALEHLPNDVDREQWINICLCIRDAGLDFDDWRNWCNGWTRGTNSERNIRQAWDSCATPRNITYRTLLKMADDADPSWRRAYHLHRDQLRRERYIASMQDWCKFD